jgi:hypothetical protein
MVNITKCEVCGRVIPATEHGCAYCERERRDQAQLSERPYLPLAIRLLLILLLVDALAVAALSGGSLWRALAAPGKPSLPAVAVPAARIMLAAAAVAGALLRRPVGRWLCLGFIGAEAAGGLLSYAHLLGPVPWTGAPLEPIWTALFCFLFLRADVIRRYDVRAADRRELHSLMRNVQKGRLH